MAIAELLCTDLTSVEAALQAGADRIELCAALEVGGVTPGIGFLRAAVALAKSHPTGVGIVALIRPRRGDFLLDGPGGLALLVAEIAAAREVGAEGVAVGVLGPDGRVDAASMAALVEAAAPLKVTFHRAIDHVAEPVEAVRTLIELGVARLLTSGGAESAIDGAVRIRSLVDAFGQDLEIVAAGGIHGGNAAEVLRSTGAPAIHGSCSRRVPSSSHGRTGAAPVRMGAAEGSLREDTRSQLDPSSARAFVEAARSSSR
ncbi:Copper homeostasis protein CutC [Planctomycetes bacterium Poly30]|uniref:PF03932 family protein CutC n=1 Tax=Saltatorellus ferox TaxID=2528018 RepID=A0A518ESF9_9BACT|nr:Copper homeostasis protein CutC [Planctomycetes bacterium Poly30]